MELLDPIAARVRLFRSDRAAERDALIREGVGAFAGVGAAGVEVIRRCDRCGSDEHGMPRIVAPRPGAGGSHRGAGEYFVSLSRVATLTLVAVTDAAPIGIDVESIARIAAAPVDAALLHPAEAEALAAAPDPGRRRAVLWTAKEAVLKATGHGLNLDPRLLRLEVGGDAIELVDWPGALALAAAPRIHPFALGDDLVGAVAVLAPPSPG